MKVSSLHLYPVKAAGVVDAEAADVDLGGLRHDRRWAVVNPQGRVLHGTTHDVLMTVTPRPQDDGALLLTAPGLDDLLVPVPASGTEISSDLSRQASLTDAGDAAADWLSAVAGERVRLGHQPDPTARPISDAHGGRGDEPLSLADTAPLLLTTTASLRRLEEWIAADHEPQAMHMGRFRPNVVVDGDLEPFVEDNWRQIIIGGVPYRFTEHCDRCVVTTIDPVSRQRGKEPIRTLAKHHRWDGQTWFGIRIAPLRTGEVRVGDGVTADSVVS